MNSRPGHPEPQPGEVNARVVLTVVLIVSIVVVLVTVFSTVLLRRDGPSRAGPTESAPSRTVRLSSNPDAEIEAYRQEKTSQLDSYGWIDREHGIAHVPIDRAMQIIAAPEPRP
jgi:hypothetical protein